MIQDYLEKISDPRRAQAKKYKLSKLLLFSIFAILCGADSYRDICRFIAKKRIVLNERFDVRWKRGPSKSQLRDTICSIKVSEMENAFRSYSRALNDYYPNMKNQVGLDGKSLCGSVDHKKDISMLQLLSAFCAETKLILGHVDISEKTNEIPTVQALIQALGLPAGTIYTADALHCQKKPLKRLK